MLISGNINDNTVDVRLSRTLRSSVWTQTVLCGASKDTAVSCKVGSVQCELVSTVPFCFLLTCICIQLKHRVVVVYCLSTHRHFHCNSHSRQHYFSFSSSKVTSRLSHSVLAESLTRSPWWWVIVKLRRISSWNFQLKVICTLLLDCYSRDDAESRCLNELLGLLNHLIRFAPVLSHLIPTSVYNLILR